MSNTPNPARGSDADAGSHLTVEDAGSTTSVSDLFSNDTRQDAPAPARAARSGGVPDEDAIGSADAVASAGAVGRSGGTDPGTGAPSAPGAPEPPSAPAGSSAADDDFAIGHVFDQTNGVIEGLDGDSDGSADSDDLSAAERADENPAFDSFADSEVQPGSGADDPRTTGN